VVRADRRDAAATGLGVAGRLADRARRYALEREAFAWWSGELVWTYAPRRTAASRRPAPSSYRCTDSGTYAAQLPPWNSSLNIVGDPVWRTDG